MFSMKLTFMRFSSSVRYAALNLASLHFCFGHTALAKTALNEAITLAQETADHVCLQHALAWKIR